MSKLITRIKRLALALCLVTPIVSWAVTTKGYEDFGDTAGVVLWRGTQNDFHASNVADVAADGTVGDEYTMNTSGHPWQVFARGQSAYTSPGKVLVYDTAGTGSGYKYNPDCTFTPISFGGMWVKTLAINGQPFSILGNNAGRRYTEFGASDKSTLFKFDASFTINRTSPTTFFGEATVDIAQDATFTAQADSSYHVVVDSAATLKLKGAGTLAVTTMDVNGTLDLSATTRPTISGNVTLVGTIVLPEGTEVSQENPFTVCSGTLSAANAYVKIGDADAALKRLTISGGAITALSDPVYEYTENYPTVVPAGQVFTFIGGDTAESATVASGVTVNGTLNTRGHISLTGLTTAKESMLEVVDGTATVTASAAQSLAGDIKIDAGATMVNAMTADALNYGWGVYVHVYGTLDMGSTRWTVGSNARIYLYEGGLITGAGQGSNGAIDITSANVRVIASGDSTISANMRVRAANIPVEATEGKTLTISGLINDGVSYGEPGSITKQNSGTLVLTTAPTFTKALKLEAGTLELGGTAASSSVTVAASAATVAASSGSTLTGELIFVSHIPSAANKALIASEAFDGAVVLTGTFSSAADITGLGAEVTLRDFTGFLNKSASTSGIKVNVEGTFTQSNGWSYDADRIYLAEIKGNGTMTQSGSQAQLYEVGSIANFTGTFNLTNARIKSNNNAVLDKAQKIATLTVAKTLTVNGGSLTGNLAANDIAVTVDGTPAVGDVLVPVTGTVSVSGTVTVNGDEVEVECVTGEGVKFAGYPTVTITVPAVPNATVVVSDGSTTYEPTTEGGASYVVPEGANITATYTANEDYSFDGATSVFELLNVAEGDEVTVGELVAKAYVASFNSQKYTTLQAAVNAWAAADMMTAYMNLVTLIDDVTEASVSIPARADGVPCQLSSANKTLTGNVTIAADATLSTAQTSFVGNVVVNGTIYTLTALTVDGNITIADGGAVSTTSLGETAILTATGIVTASGDITFALYSNSLTAGTYPVVAGASVVATDIQPTVLLNNVEDPSWAFSVTGTQIVLTGAAARVGDETYADFADAVTAAAGEETIELLNNIAYTLAVGETIIIKAGTCTFNVSVPAGYVVEATAQGDGVVSYTTAVAGANLKRERLDGDWEVTSSVDYKTVADAIAEAGEDGAALRWTVTLLADATDITLDRAITVNAGEYDVTGTITVTVDSATVTVSNEPTLGTDTWVTERNNGTITVRYGATSTVTVEVTGNGTAALETGDRVKATETAGTYAVKDGTSVKLTAEFGDEYKVDETSSYTNSTGTNTLPQPAAQQDYVMVPVNGDTTISVVIVPDTVSFEVAAVAGTTVVVMDGATEVVPVAGVYTIPAGDTVQIKWVEDADHIVTNGQTDWITPGDGTTVAAPAGMTVEDVVAMIGSAKYATIQEALDVGGEVTLLANQTLTASLVVAAEKTVVLDLNGKTVNGVDPVLRNNGTLTINDTVGGGKLKGGSAIQVKTGSTTVIKGGTFEGGDGCIWSGNSNNYSVTIDGGTFSSTDNAILMGNGNPGNGVNSTWTINDGTFTGGIQEPGYIACGIYAPDAAAWTINGGTFNITGGCGIAVRAGVVSITGGTINASGTATGWVGDKKAKLPCAAVIYDVNPGAYPGYDSATSKVAITGGTFTSDVAEVQMNGNGLVTTTDNTLTIAEGYRWSDPVEGICTLEVIPETPVIDPDSDEPVEVPVDKNADEADAQAAADAIPVKTTTEIEEILDDVVPTTPGKTAQEEYQANFKRVVAQDDDGNWVVTETTIKEEVVEEASDEVLDALEEVTATDDEITIVAKPGLQYGLVAGDDLGTVNSGTPQTMIRAGADGKVTLTIPQIEGEDIMFFKLVISQ